MDNQSSVSSLAERLGSRREKSRDHAKEHRLSKADIGGPISTTENKTDATDTSEPSGATAMVIRCVIIQRNERGYGLTVSGDNPVYVQSVKENGAAYTAGVRQRDRIIKVNGTNVTDFNHIEVVKLIKSGNHVSLTLVSPPVTQADSSSTTVSHGSNISSTPSVKRPQSTLLKDNAFHDEKVNTIKKMLEQEKAEVEAESVKQNQDIPIQQLNQDLSVNQPPAGATEMENMAEEQKDGADTGVKPDAEKPKDASDKSQQRNIMNFDEDELAEESDNHQNHGPFQDFETLKTSPAHTAVFLNYVFRSHDSCPLLLVLTVEQYRLISSAKELVKLSDVISKTYLAQNAPLKVAIDEGIAKSIVEAIQSRTLSDDPLRTVFDPAVQHALKTVKAQLQGFCKKRELGLSNCFGEEKLSQNMEHTQEVRAVEEILTPLLQELGPQNGFDDAEIPKMNARMDALERLLSHWTGKRKIKLTSRIGSMLRPSKPNAPTLRPKNAHSVESIIDEQNKRTSIFGKIGPKKQKTKDTSLTVIPIVQPAHQDSYAGETGLVTSMVNKFQDPNAFSNDGQAGAGQGSESNLGVSGKTERSGSFRGERRPRSATGKSISDPDLNVVEQALRGNTENSSDFVMSSSMSNSSISSSGIPSSQTSGSLSSAAADDMIRQLVALNPELDVEPESQWSSTTPRDVIRHLDKKECKRQEIINELLHTEKHHVRDLLILHLLFYQKMQSEGGLTQEELFIVFPNLQEILAMHRKLRKALTDLKERDGYVIKDIASVLSEMFNGPEGEKFKNQCAQYCGNQTGALEFIRERCKKDQKFSSFIQTTEKHPICRRLQLKDFVPVEFQRLTKYPLLLENIIKNTKKKEETNKLKQVHKQCKEILHYVNKAVKDAEDYQKIVEIQKNLDSSSLNKVNHPVAQEYKNIILTERKLVHQGPLTWRITQTEKKKSVVLHCVLFEDIMVLLQKQEEKYVLKCHTSVVPPNSTKEEKSAVQPPILKLSRVLVRNVATDKRAFYVLSTSEFGAQIYELVASSVHEMQEWFKIVLSTADIAKKRDVSTPHPRRDAFMVPETSRSNKGNIEPDKVEEKLDTESDVVDGGGSILEEIQRKHDEIAAALTAKHSLLASYAGIASSEFDNILDMSLTDSDPDQKTVIFRLLSTCNKLTTILNDTLSPDTDFLQPAASQVLLPTPEVDREKSVFNSSSEPSTPKPSTPTYLDVVPAEVEPNTEEKPKDTMRNNWVESEEKENVETDTSLLQEPTSETGTSDRHSNASLELLMSDYETASEPPSPTSAAEEMPLGENLDTQDNESSSLSAEQSEQEISDSVTSPSDAGIGMSEARAEDEESVNTLSAVETIDNSVDKLVSPIAFDSDDLLDFGVRALSPPQVTVSSLPSAIPNATGLLGRANPVNLTQLLEISHSMESQLLLLMKLVKDSSIERQQLAEENLKLKNDLAEERAKLLSGISERKNDTLNESNDTVQSAQDDSSLTTDQTDEPPAYSEVESGR